MSGACDNFILEDQSCEWFELVQYVESFDMGINFLEGPPGPPGPAGEAIFIPFVSQDGWISWTNTAGLPNPDPVYIKGPPGGGGSGDYDDLTDKPSINGVTLSGNKTTAELLIAFTAADVGLGNVANERQYSAQNPPPYPVSSVAGKVGAISLLPSDVGLGNVANERQYSAQNPPPYPVTSVNGQTGTVVLDAADVGALPDDYTPPVTSVNGQTGAVVITEPKYSDATTITGTVAVSSGNATGTWRMSYWGNWAWVYVDIRLTQNIPVGGTITGTLTNFPTGYSPMTRGVGWLGSTMALFNVGDDGSLFVRCTVAQANSGAGLSAYMLMSL